MKIIDQIFLEETLLENEFFHIVEDISPICPTHLMAFHKGKINSISILDEDLFEDLFNQISTFWGKNFYFFERGNASFCTSLHGDICSHIHFLPKEFFIEDLTCNLYKKAKFLGKEISNLCPTKKEYFFFGDINNRYFFHIDQKPEKQFFRTNFTNYLVK